MQQVLPTKISMQQGPLKKNPRNTFLDQISFTRRKINVQMSQREKSTCYKHHQQTSERNKFHE